MSDIFIGISYRLADNWISVVNPIEYIDRPINYLEIGTFYGANLFSVAQSYALHKDSKLYCIDPWQDYSDYSEYKGEQDLIYNMFLQNLDNSSHKNKIVVKRGFSNKEIYHFQDDFFDIIYVDGNHEPEYVLEDAVMSFRKLKSNGILIFDDYGWGGPDKVQKGIDAFLFCYHDKIIILGIKDQQVFVKKI